MNGLKEYISNNKKQMIISVMMLFGGGFVGLSLGALAFNIALLTDMFNLAAFFSCYLISSNMMLTNTIMIGLSFITTALATTGLVFGIKWSLEKTKLPTPTSSQLKGFVINLSLAMLSLGIGFSLGASVGLSLTTLPIATLLSAPIIFFSIILGFVTGITHLGMLGSTMSLIPMGITMVSTATLTTLVISTTLSHKKMISNTADNEPSPLARTKTTSPIQKKEQLQTMQDKTWEKDYKKIPAESLAQSSIFKHGAIKEDKPRENIEKSRAVSLV
jgi:hypothetical protein